MNDHSRRIQRINFVHAIIESGDTISEQSVIVAGSWLPYLIQATPVALPESEFPDYILCRKNIQYVDMLNADLLSRFQKQGLKMYYLSTVEIVNLEGIRNRFKERRCARIIFRKDLVYDQN